jgi:hypothetical protein
MLCAALEPAQTLTCEEGLHSVRAGLSAQDAGVRWVGFVLLTLALAVGVRLPEAWAGTVDGLYEAEVPVASQDAKDRDRALRTALLEVVVRVSGQRRVSPTGVLSAAVQNPSRYVQEYGYGALPGGGGASRPAAAGAPRLWARFDPNALNQLLRQAGLPVWGRSRPTTLIWLAVERGDQRDFVGVGDPLAGALQGRARARGLPIALPSLDPQERGGVRVEDVWNDLPDKVTPGSRRFGADAVLLGRARERIPGLWETRWTLVAGGSPERFTADGEQIDKVVAEGLDKAVDVLVGRLPQASPTSTQEGPLPELVVTGVSSFEDYARVRKYLEGVDGVSSVQTAGLDPGRVIFRIKARNDREGVSRSVALGRTLAPVQANADWTFQLVP